MTTWSKSLTAFLLGMLAVSSLIAVNSIEAQTPQGNEQAAYTFSGEFYEGAPGLLDAADNPNSCGTPCKKCLGADGHQCAFPCQAQNLKPDNKYQGIEVGQNRWIRMACAEALDSVKNGGGPFGAVVVQIDNETNRVLRFWRCRNQVTRNIDPTAHAEVSALRTAAAELGVFQLGEIHRDDPQLKLAQSCETSRCEIYSSCEPCPMCYAAIRWARIDTLVFAATRYDAAEPGVNFSDLQLYRELETPYQDRNADGLRVFQATAENSLDAFNLWKNSDKVDY